jgi:murein DD-endopeptidase MepM/ murein hydrolase activator NlpD
MNMKIFLISIIATVIVGSVLVANASRGNRTFMDNVPINGTNSEVASTDDQSTLAVANTDDQAGYGQSLIDTSGDDPEPEDDDTIHEIPDDLPVQGSSANQLVLKRCIEESAQDKALIQEICPGKIPQGAFCALEDVESGGTMCLGALLGEPCKKSSGGAEGRCQVKPKTAAEWATKAGVIGAYNPQNLEHSKRVAIAYLCHVLNTVGEQNMFRAYNGGPIGFDKPKYRNATIRYDQYVRRRAPIYQAALEGKINLVAVGTVAAATEISPPLPENTGPITSTLGELRPYRNKPGKKGIHEGDDIHAAIGTPAFAIRSGCKVVAIGWNKEGGKKSPGFYAGIKVIMNCGNGTPMTLASVRYYHLSLVAPQVVVGYRPTVREVIGYTGDTGGKTGRVSMKHLHLETHEWAMGGRMIPSNPSKWTDLSAFAPESSLYKGPRDEVWREAKAKFLAMAAKGH